MPIAFTAAGTFSGTGDSQLSNPTSLQFGPDGRLYVSEQNGSINAFTVEKQGDTWVATAGEQLVDGNGNELVKSIQNHNDDGSEASASNRQVTGIVVAGTADEPILYISSSDPRISSNNDSGLDTNSGIVTQATFNSTTDEWEVVDLVRGLPRSEENHAVNGMLLSEDGTKLLLNVGGFTNNGAPSSFFSYTNEYALSGSVLELDLTALNALPDLVDAEGGQGNTPRTYKYDLPTLDDPNIENITDGVGEDEFGMDEDGPFGGNDGLNMAILPADAPLRLYADGTRNDYDLARGENGLIYTVDNGSNGGLGAEPNTENGDDDGDGVSNEAIATPNNGGQGEGEPFHQIVEGGYYYHPNPVRSNQNMSWTVYDNNGNPDTSLTVNTVADISELVPDAVNIADGFLIDPSKFAISPGVTLADLTVQEQQDRLQLSGVWINSNQLDNNPDPDGDGPGQATIAQLGSSTNGIIVYDSGGAAFGGSIDGAVFVTQFNDNVTLLNVNDTGTDLLPIFEEGPDGIFGTADDVVQDADGILQVANNGTGVPLGNPLDITQGPGGTLWVAEIGSNEVTVLEPTVVLDPTSEDADFDGILNQNDPFSRDATNGTSVVVNGAAPTVWEFSQGANDTTPGPDGFGGGLTGAMINGVIDYEAFYLEENPNDPPNLRLDNVKFVTAAGGGTTTIEEVSNGDPLGTANNGEYLFHTGFVLDQAVDTFTISWVVANPAATALGSDITSASQQIGGYTGDGTQSNYLKIVAVQTNGGPKIQILLEEAVNISTNPFVPLFEDQVLQAIELDAPGIFDNANLVEDSAITLELQVDLTAKTATPRVTYESTSGPVEITGQPDDVIDLAPGGQDTVVMQTFLGNTEIALGEQQGIAAGTFSSNTGSASDSFQAVFDSITVTATEASLPPVAVDDTATTQTDMAIDIPVAQLLANDTDANSNEVLTITAVSNPVNGTVALDNGVVTFTPASGFQGDASFDYTVEDSTGNTDTGSVTVAVSDLTVLFRLNAAGDTINALPDDPYGSTLAWESAGAAGAQSGTQSGLAWSVTNTNVSTHNITGRDADVPDYVPQGLYAVERWDPTAAPDMQWTFGSGDLPSGTYTVNIIAGNGFGGTSGVGQRVFDIQIEDELAFDNVDLSAQFGHQTGGFFSYQVEVIDGTLNVELGRDGVDSAENPTINAIEILQGAVGELPLTLSIVNGDQTVNEGDGSALVSIITNRTVPIDESVNFTYVIEGVTATPEIDYSPDESLTGEGTATFTGNATIAGGSSDFQIPIDILQDTDLEGAETFTVTITSVSPNATLGQTTQATITIADDDVVVLPGEAIIRINAGGPEVAANDGGIAWAADQAEAANGSASTGPSSPFLIDRGVTDDNVSFGVGSVDGANATGAPDALFTTERFSTLANPNNIGYAFDVANGDYVVNLYFDELFFGVDGSSGVDSRIFDVAIEGNLVLDDFQTYVAAGNSNDTVLQSFNVTVADGTLNLELLKTPTNNPHIAAIEIIASDPSAPIDTVNGVPVVGGDFSSNAAAPTVINLPTDGTTTIVSNLEGGHNDRDFFTVSIQDGYRLADVILTDYTADPGNSGFLGIQVGSDFVIDPAIPPLGQTPDGVVDPGDLSGGYVFNENDEGNDLLPSLNAPTFGFAGFDESALTGDVTFWLNQGGDASQATLTFVTEEIPSSGGEIVAAINAGGPALTQDGIDFAADAFFLNGTAFSDGNSGNGPQPVFDGTVYETERFGGSPGNAPLGYEIPVNPGEYQVELYFAEIFQPNGAGDGIGARVFDVSIEGQLILDDFDILAETSGDFNQPIIVSVAGTFDPSATGNPDALDIDIAASEDNGKISAIVVRDATPPPPSGGEATLTVNNNSNNIQISNFGNGSFVLTNTGTKDIESFNIDVTDAIYPDAVFDPFGLAGDTTAKQMTITGGSGTGVQEPTGGYYIGAGGILGYEGVQLDFDSSVDSGFNPGESVAFAVDMDPNSIAGALKSTLDSGAIPAWDIGGISGAELIGSTFTITFTDGTTATGQLQGQTNGAGAALQGGSEGLASQDAAGTDVTLTVNGLAEGASGTYTDGGPTVILDGPIGATVRVTMTKGIIQPFDNNFPDTADPNEYHDQLDAQLAVLAASEFPANNSALFETFDVVLTEANQDISSLFNFTDVPGIDLAPRDEAQLPLGFVAGVIDPVTNQPIGPISSPIHLSYSENAAPTIDPIADIEIDEAQTASFNIVANDADGDTVALSVEVMRDIDGTIVDASAYSFTDNGDGTGSFSWETDEADDGSYSVAVTADDGLTQTTQSVGLIVNEIAGPQPGDILYRVNAGGAEVAASDGGPAWSADTQASNSPFLVNPGSNNDFPSNGQPNLSVDISMLSGTGAVAEMIGIERWDNTNDANGEMLWQFPVVAGTEIEVRLYLAELFGGLPDLDGSGDPTGDRIFDVSVDGTVPAAFTGLDPYALAGNAFNTGAVVSHTFTSDGIVDLEFLHVSENTAIKGIEIIVAGTPDTDGPTASLTAADVTTVDTTYTFEVTFSDATGVDVSTLDNLDVTVSNGALAFSATATLVSIDVPADGSPRTATYEITPPGGSWDGTDNGTYTVTLNDGEVGDILGNVAPQSVLGTFEVTAPSSNASALVEITPDGGLGDSTFTASSFQITNTSEPGVEITGVEIDLSTAILPDMVFDPTGAGGDATASGFTPNFGGVDTGLIAPADPFVDPFSQARNGGFDIITINFSDFDPGEQFFFTTDVDPNSIQAVPGAGNAGSVSGYELTGATVTVTFSDGRVVTGSLYEDGSLGGSQVLIDSDVVQVAPTIELIGAGPDESSLPGEQASVNNVDQIVRVTGTAGDNVSLLQMDARLFIASGNPPFDVSPDELPFYANEAMSGQTLYSATIGAGGFVDIPVMLLKTDGGATPDGGLNHFIAVTTPTPYAVDQATSLTSNTLIVKLGAELVYDAPGVMEFDGTTAGVLELEHQGDWAIPQGTVAFSFNAADTDGAQGLFSKDASGFVGGGNHFLIYLNGDTLTARFQNGIDGGNSVSLEVPGIVAGTEYEVAATFGPDGSEIWLNGNLVANDPLVMDWTTNVEFVQWGGRGWASSSGTAGFDAPFEGTISDKQIYAGVLSASEIAALAATSSGQNSPPTVTDDSAVTDEDVVLVINVADLVQNDSDVDGDSLDVSQIAVDPANGTAVLDGVAGTITYTPNPDFNGPDSFDVTVTDGINSVISTVNVTVNPVNDDPIAIDDVTSTVVDTPVIIDATSNDIDADGDTLNIAAVTQGSFGSVAIDPSGNTVTYTPNGGSTGTDSFTYTIDDGNGGVQDTATVTVSVLEAPNNPPVAVDDDDIVVDEDGSVTFQPGGNDTDSDGDTVVAAAIASDPSNGVAVVNADNTVTYTPNANYNGSDTFEVQVTDGNGGFDTSTVVVTVNAVNDAPVANNDAATTSQDTAVVINVLANDTDADLDGLTVTVVTDGDNGTVVSNGGSVTYTPNAGFVGDDSFTYTASDGEGGTNTATVNVTVNSFPTPVYDAPAEMVFDGSNGNVLELEPLPIYSFEEGTISFEFTASSLGNDRGLFSRDASGLTGNGNHIAVYVDNSVLTMRVQDGANTAFLTASGIVAGVSYDVAAVFAADGAKLYVDGVEADSSAVTTSWVNNPEYLQFGSLGWGSSTGGSGFRSQNNFQGSMSDKKIFSEALSDAQVAELHADGPINLSPIAVDDSVAATEDAGTVNIDVGANDSDPEMATVLADSIVADPTNGTAIVLADGTVDYTPDADFFGIDMFDVQVTDGAGGFDTSTVTVTVDGVEDDPVAVDDIASVQQDGQVTIDVLSNDSDADGDMLSVASNTNPSNGMVVDNLDGTFTYTPNAGFVGSDSFEYTLSDGAGPTDTATVSVTVNDSPVLPMPVFELPGVNTFDDSTSDVFNFAPDVALQQEAITVAFSFSADTFSGNQGLVVKDASFFGGGGHFAALLSGDDLDVRIQDTDSSFTLNLDNLNLGQEYEAAVVVSDNLAQLWVDGALIEETTSIDATWDTNTEYLQVGGLGWGSAAGDDSFSDPFSGQIADVEIYDVALSSDQIQQLADDSSFDLL